ncbi:MAG: DUF1178 family protein [Beijerinckiaceae bacterium]|nr:DUF1178 family protein [Beijerinckiaceae bacterium]
MILYALACGNGHQFESWFRGSVDYDAQAVRGLVACPLCHSTDVAKTIMAPAVVSRGGAAMSSSSGDAQGQEMVLLDERQVEARQLLKNFRDKVISETEDVGTQFPDEARKMHEGDIPHRHIRGTATLEEARTLIEEGVALLPLPNLPEELN